MSLKAKLEAVIYAAEEPVTLAQLAALFATDALEWKAEQEAASAAAEPGAEPLPLLNEGFDYLEPVSESAGPEPEAGPVAGSEPAPEAEPVEAPEAAVAEEVGPDVEGEPELDGEAGGEPVSETATAEPETLEPEAPEVDAEAEAKRLARVRDREVKAVLRVGSTRRCRRGQMLRSRDRDQRLVAGASSPL
jgi:segregation and condensation protein B